MVEFNIKSAGYSEQESVIKDIQFAIPMGHLVGLIGANGAGKSTTIQAIMGTIPYCEGELHIPAYGYVPERPILYEHFTLWEHIQFLIKTVGQDEEMLTARAKELCKVFRLSQNYHDYPTHFSKGMQQKVMLILAFTPIYEFYIVDEPFMGLDPQAMRKLLTLLTEYKEKGAAILMSTHALDTAEKICDSFVLLHEGRLLKQGTLQQLQDGRDVSLLQLFDEVIEEQTNEDAL